MMHFFTTVPLPSPIGMQPGSNALLHGLIVVAPHDQRVLDDAVGSDQGSQPDHRVLHLAPVPDDAPIPDHAALAHAVDHLAGRQEPGHGVDGKLVVIKRELELVPRLAKREVGLVKGLDRPDVLPVPVEQEGLDIHADGVGAGDDLPH